MKAILLGVPGVGKSSIAKGLAGQGWKVVSYGTVMMEAARERYGISHRDEMRKRIHGEAYRKLQEEAADRIGALEGKVVVDTHATVKTPEGFLPGLPQHVIERIRPAVFVVVEAAPGDIAKWREKDGEEREREGNPAEHQLINRYFVAAYSAITGAPVYFVKNEDGRLQEAVVSVLEVLELVRSRQ